MKESTKKSFSGKFTFMDVNGNYMEVQPGGKIALEKDIDPISQSYFNLYGPLLSDAWIQADNWKYLTYNEEEKVFYASENRDDESLSIFKLDDKGSNKFCILEIIDDQPAFYLNAVGNDLVRVQITPELPLTALFTRNEITFGIESIQKYGAQGRNLTGVYLGEEDLSGIRFGGANISFANFNNAILKGANFQGCYTNGTIMINSHLENVNLTGIRGTGPQFDGCTFYSTTNLNGAEIPEAKFIEVNSNGSAAKFNNIKAQKSVFSNSDLSGIIFNVADLTEAEFVNVNLDDTSMADVTFDKALMTRLSSKRAVAQNSSFRESILVNADFTDAIIIGSDFTAANLTNADLSKAKGGVTEINIEDAILIATNLTGLDLTTVKISAKTNFTQAQMDDTDLTGHNLDEVTFLNTSMRRVKLDNTSCLKSIFVGADLSFGSATGNVSFIGADLSNAKLEGVNITGGQFGPVQSKIFILNKQLANTLDQGIIPDAFLKSAQEIKKSVSKKATLIVRKIGSEWVIKEDETWFINKTEEGLQVDVTDSNSNGAVLVNAFMPNAKLTGANLYAVNMSGVNWYGASARADNANLEQVNFTQANLATMNFKQGKMYGANLSFAVLIGTDFSGAKLTPTQSLNPASLAFSSLQGADFTEAQLASGILTNAAVSLHVSLDTKMKGNKLFSIDPAFISSLDKNEITSGLVAEFKNNGQTISTSDCLTEIMLGSSWIIRRTGSGEYQQYILVLNTEIGLVDVYGESADGNTTIPFDNLTGVPLFNIKKSFQTDLNDGMLTNDLKTVFTEHGYPLIDTACITVTEEDKYWTIRNNETDPAKLIGGYSKFSLLRIQELGEDDIEVFGGSPIDVVRTGPDNVLEIISVAFGPNIFTEKVFDDNTTCPSGLKYGMLKKGIPLAYLMTPGLPPHPPSCIPSPTTWC